MSICGSWHNIAYPGAGTQNIDCAGTSRQPLATVWTFLPTKKYNFHKNYKKYLKSS